MNTYGKKMILTYTDQNTHDFSESCMHEPIMYLSKEEWLKLIHFNNEDVDSMSEVEIHRRIAALKSIEESPHLSFNWTLNNDQKFKKFVTSMYDNTLNGSAGFKIYLLEKYLAGKKAPDQ